MMQPLELACMSSMRMGCLDLTSASAHYTLSVDTGFLAVENVAGCAAGLSRTLEREEAYSMSLT